MNYLAHLYLSGNNDDLRLGNFIADAIKGSNLEYMRPNIKKGIILHRYIDSYTDNNDIVNQAKLLIKSNFPKYSGIIVDICFDHFLAKNWINYSDIKLRAFVRNFYILMVLNYTILPKRVKRSLPFLISQNWLESYKDLNGIGKIYDRMNIYRGLPWNSKVIIPAINNNYIELENLFNIFFPDLIKVSNKKIEDLLIASTNKSSV